MIHPSSACRRGFTCDPSDSGQTDLFRARLDQIIDLKHPLVRLADITDWTFLEQQFGAVYDEDPGRPPLPTRLMAGLAILKHMHDLSDEALCARWVENPCFQFFSTEEFFCHTLPFDRSSMTRWPQRMGEERLMALLQESLAVATRTSAAKPADFRQVIVDLPRFGGRLMAWVISFRRPSPPHT